MGAIPVKNVIQGFSRLKGIFRSGLNYRTYAKICGTAERQVVGNIPKDVLSRVISGNSNKAVKRESILGIQSVFEQTAKVLSENETLAHRTISRIPESYGTFYRECAHQADNKKALFSIGQVLGTEASTEICIRAEESMLKGLQQYIPEAHNVIITPIGSGSFSIGYKVEVLDSSKKKLFSDKVIKVFFKDFPDIRYEEKLNKVVSKLSDKQLLKARKSIVPESKVTAQEIRETYANITELKDLYRFAHGAYAEANATSYIKAIAKGKTSFKNGLVLPDMYNLGETKFAISEFVDSSTKAEKTFHFGNYALGYTDWFSGGNNIGGAYIDIGGVVPLSDLKLESKAASNIVGRKEGYKIFREIAKTPSEARKSKMFEIDGKIQSMPSGFRKKEQLDALNETWNIFRIIDKHYV